MSKKLDEYSILDIIEAGLRDQGVEQEYIDEAKRQISREIELKNLSPEARMQIEQERRKQMTQVRSTESVRMPTPEEMVLMYEKEAAERLSGNMKGTTIGIVDLVTAKRVPYGTSATRVGHPETAPKLGFFAKLKDSLKRLFTPGDYYG